MYRIHYLTDNQFFDYIELDYKYVIGGDVIYCLADSFCYINNYVDEDGKITVTEELEITRCEENDIEEKQCYIVGNDNLGWSNLYLHNVLLEYVYQNRFDK